MKVTTPIDYIPQAVVEAKIGKRIKGDFPVYVRGAFARFLGNAQSERDLSLAQLAQALTVTDQDAAGLLSGRLVPENLQEEQGLKSAIQAVPVIPPTQMDGTPC